MSLRESQTVSDRQYRQTDSQTDRHGLQTVRQTDMPDLRQRQLERDRDRVSVREREIHTQSSLDRWSERQTTSQPRQIL